MSFAVWLTGLSGSGKSAIARELVRLLHERGVEASVLESDVMRTQLTPFPRYDDNDRDFFIPRWRRSFLVEKGRAVVFDATANRRATAMQRASASRASPRCSSIRPSRCAPRATRKAFIARQARCRACRPYEPPLAPELVVHGAEGTPLMPRARSSSCSGARLGLKKIAAGAVALALAGYGVALLFLGPKVEVVEAVRREVVQAVVATGRIESPFRVEIGAQVVGTVVRVPVAQGETVAAGQTLIELDAAEAHALVRQAEAAVIQAEGRLRQLRSCSCRSPRSRCARRRRTTPMRARSSSATASSSRAASSASRCSMSRSATWTWRRPRSTPRASRWTPRGPGQRLRARGRRARAGQRRTAGGARALAYTRIVAPVDRHAHRAQRRARRRRAAGQDADGARAGGETQIVVQIDERNIGLLRLASRRSLRRRLPGKALRREVAYINPGVDAQRGTVEVKLRVRAAAVPAPGHDRVGRHRGGAQPRARRASAEAVRDATGASPWVLRVEGGRARAPQRGARAARHRLGRDPLGPRARRAVVPAAAPIQPGSRVRAVPHA